MSRDHKPSGPEITDGTEVVLESGNLHPIPGVTVYCTLISLTPTPYHQRWDEHRIYFVSNGITWSVRQGTFDVHKFYLMPPNFTNGVG